MKKNYCTFACDGSMLRACNGHRLTDAALSCADKDRFAHTVFLLVFGAKLLALI